MSKGNAYDTLDGHGDIRVMPDATCLGCGGHGTRHAFDGLSVEICERCGGRGKVPAEPQSPIPMSDR